MYYFLIKKGPRPAYHRAPFHPVIICDRKAVAKTRAGSSRDAAWVWESCSIGKNDSHICGGLLLCRWNGFDIDYGHIVSGITLPDGTEGAFAHDREKEPWTLFAGAIWWSIKEMPLALKKAGVIYPPDRFSRNRILEDYEELKPNSLEKPEPPIFWPPITETESTL